MKKKGIIILVLIAAIGSYFYFSLYPKLEIISGISAKNLCSCLYVSGFSQAEAEKTDLGFSLLWLASNTANAENKTVETSVLGMQRKKAVYREGRGCTLQGEKELKPFNPKANIAYAPEIWPNTVVTGTPEMQAVLQKAFDANGETKLNTRAVLVVHNGEIVGEAYADVAGINTPLLGWSMAKSVTSCLVGILAKDGYWQTDEQMDIPEWQADERKNITLNHLLQMSSGLNWEENYKAVSTATKMLYESDDMGAYAQSQPLAYEPGSEWLYSSGTTNIIAHAMANAFPDMESYQRFPYERLFGPIGAKSFVIETDASGHFIGSTYGYASARDWAKVGLLYLQEGNWNGAQIIDSTWVDYCRTETPESDGAYGGQFWLNRNDIFPSYDENAYWMSGFHSQQVSIHPDRDLVVVRLGVTYERGGFDFDGWMKEIYEVVE